MPRRLRFVVVLLAASAVGAPGAAEAACVDASVEVSVTPVLGASHVIPVRWRVDPSCAVVETGLLLGREPGALARAGEPVHAPGPDFLLALPVTESGPWWVAAYARDERGAVVRSAPRLTVVLVPPVLPLLASGPSSSTATFPSETAHVSAADDADFLQPAGDPHFAALRRITQTSRRFTIRDPDRFSFFTQGFDARRITSTRPEEVVSDYAPPLTVGGVAFPVDPGEVAAAVAAADAVFADLGYPRSGLYDVRCHVFARFAPDSQLDGPTCEPLTYSNEYFPDDPQWLTWAQTGNDVVGQSNRASLTYFIPRVPEGKQLRSARLRLLAYGNDALDPIGLSGKPPASLDGVSCTQFSCWAWATWDLTEEAKLLSERGGGELALTMDPVPPKASGYGAGVATWSIMPRVNYPWRHGGEDSALAITFEEACPTELEVTIAPGTLRPVMPQNQSQAAGLTPVPTQATVTITARRCAQQAQEAQPIDVILEVHAPTAADTGENGGHEHDAALRWTGTLEAPYSDGGARTATCRIETFDEQGVGVCETSYFAGGLGGVEAIVAVAAGFPDAASKVTVEVPGLVGLPESPGQYVLVGAPGNHGGTNDPCRPFPPTSEHTRNHHGRTGLVRSVRAIARSLVETTGILPRINDMSLPQGGLFDVNNTWGSPHRTHRTGRDVDIGFTGVQDGRCVTFEAEDLRDTIEEATGKVPLGEGDHFHVFGD